MHALPIPDHRSRPKTESVSGMCIIVRPMSVPAAPPVWVAAVRMQGTLLLGRSRAGHALCGIAHGSLYLLRTTGLGPGTVSLLVGHDAGVGAAMCAMDVGQVMCALDL